MITRLFASAFLVAGLSQAALAQNTIQTQQNRPSTQQNQPSTQRGQPSTSTENTQAPQSIPQSIRQRLTSAGFTDVNIVPSSFFITAKDKNGRPVMMRITPNSMSFLTEVPAADSSTTGSGGGNSTSGQSQKPQ